MESPRAAEGWIKPFLEPLEGEHRGAARKRTNRRAVLAGAGVLVGLPAGGCLGLDGDADCPATGPLPDQGSRRS
jgi:hypothetical protein